MSEAVIAPPLPKKKAVKKPYVELGMTVHWFPGGDRANPHAAIVTGIGAQALNLNVLFPNSYNMGIRDSVRHVDAEDVKSFEIEEYGTWDYTPLTRALVEVLGK